MIRRPDPASAPAQRLVTPSPSTNVARGASSASSPVAASGFESPTAKEGPDLRCGNGHHVPLPTLTLESPATPLDSPAPTDAAARPTSNDFMFSIGGRNPPKAAGGFFEQIKQAAASLGLSNDAKDSVESGGREPPDFAVRSQLASLDLTPVTGDRSSVSTADYTSRLEGIPPEEAFQHVLDNPNEAFGPSGLKLRPTPTALRDGQRLMMEDASGPKTMWFPVEVRVDAKSREVTFHTLDGHPLRGSNAFAFVDDGQGGTRVKQHSEFQMSSKAAEWMTTDEALDHQHDVWRNLHQGLFDALVVNADSDAGSKWVA